MMRSPGRDLDMWARAPARATRQAGAAACNSPARQVLGASATSVLGGFVGFDAVEFFDEHP
ncbi:MAG: hypothetical protein KY440_12365, partial [Actinobacteria bacterium]|nr:hypothetical protein [Actinomycetota bacterium]